MEKKVVYERDLTYPALDDNDFGVIHMEILEVCKNGRIPVVIEGKSKHILINYIDRIVNVMQEDVFDRLDIDIRKSVDINIKANEEMKRQYGDKKYIKVFYEGEELRVEASDEIGKV